MKLKRVWIPTVIFALLLAGLAAVPFAIGRKVKSEAGKRGYQVEWQSLDWTKESVTLHGATVRGAWLKADAATVQLRLTGLELKSIDARDGHAEVDLSKRPKSRGEGEKTTVGTSASGFTVEAVGVCGSGKGRATGFGKSADGRIWAERAFVECSGWIVDVEDVKKEGKKVTAGTVHMSLPKEEPEQAVKSEPGIDRSDGVPDEVNIGDLRVEAHGASLHASEMVAKLAPGGLEVASASVATEIVQEWGTMTAKGVKAFLSKDRASFSVTTDSVGGSLGSLSQDRMEASAVAVSGKLGRADGAFEAKDIKLQVGSVKAAAEASYRGTKDFHLEASMEPTPCQGVLNSVPKGFMETMSGFTFKGTVQSSLKVDGRAGKFDVKLQLENKCKVDRVPEAMSVKAFGKKFKRIVPGAKGEIEVESGPGSEAWTPIGRVSPFMAKAVLTCEDTGFFVHHGFVTGSLENSIKENLEAGRFVRGGSTVSMQLAKNLWLTRTKTISRKAQEFFLTTYLEQSLTKQEIMELYLNVVEFGPDVYGVKKAAGYYFDKEPEDLTVGEAAFLASILPSPKKDRFSADRALSPGWAPYVKHIIKTMRTRDLISEQEEMEGLAETVMKGESKTGGLSPVRVSPGGVDPLSWR